MGDERVTDGPPDAVPVTVRIGDEADLPAVMNVLDAAMLAVDAGDVRDWLGTAVLVADADGRLLGALVLDGAEIEAVAVRPGRRGQGIGTALVEAAGARRGALTAEFDEAVRPFYASLGFDLEPVGGGRVRGRRPADDRR